MNLHHVGIVCTNEFKQQFELLAKCMDLIPGPYAVVPEFSCTCYMYGEVELVVPYAGKLLERLQEVGNHIHHFAVQTKDVRGLSDVLRQAGYPIVLDEPVVGVGETEVNFIHPLKLGIMVEIMQ